MPHRSSKQPPGRGRMGVPAAPKLPESLAVVDISEPELADDTSWYRREFTAADLSGRTLELVEIEQCRLCGVDLSGVVLTRATVTDCAIERGSLANLRAEDSAMKRVSLSGTRLTGLQWLGGVLRDVSVAECRADLAIFRFTRFRDVLFEGCDLTRADFQDAELGGASFVRCDLTAAQFSNAKLAGARFVDCVLVGIGGVASFAGATVGRDDLPALTEAMADALGIRIADPTGGSTGAAAGDHAVGGSGT